MGALDYNFRFDMCEYCQRFELLDMINDAVLLVDAKQGDILFMNHKSMELYGYSVDEQCGLSIKDLRYDAYETVLNTMNTVISQGTKGHIFTANHVKKNGAIFKAEISARYLALHGRQIIAELVRDLTVEGKMRRELEVAGKIQRRLLPRNMETPLFRMRTVFEPLEGLSGDLYDVQYREDSQILYGIIIDVMGHGIAANSQGGVLQYLFRQAVEKPIAINDKLAWINHEVAPFFNSGGFAAALIFEFDFKCQTLTYSCAGMNQFFYLSASGPKVIKSPGLFLGINENESYDQEILSFQSGESFFFLTDGLFEMIDQPIEQEHTFWSMYDLCKRIPVCKTITDDASGIGILIR
ncbi:SpoIIE family protein phosphatase [Sporomusa aerivorans]|uniref:SpoIIE family protein phosphatase n=1 Tax=Sporomusa aerivorans TaxID=204936 RepID=UPI00352B8066